MDVVFSFFLANTTSSLTAQTAQVEFSTISTLVLFLVKVFLHLFFFLSIALKIYRAICYTKLTIDWIPFINPYKWPASFLSTWTQPFFFEMTKYMPRISKKRRTFDLSIIIGLELLTLSLGLIVFCINYLALYLETVYATRDTLQTNLETLTLFL
jgi:hypothetical protein